MMVVIRVRIMKPHSPPISRDLRESLKFGFLNKFLGPLEHALCLLKLANHNILVEIHHFLVAISQVFISRRIKVHQIPVGSTASI